jgi:hypothetical protein
VYWSHEDHAVSATVQCARDIYQKAKGIDTFVSFCKRLQRVSAAPSAGYVSRAMLWIRGLALVQRGKRRTRGLW